MHLMILHFRLEFFGIGIFTFNPVTQRIAISFRFPRPITPSFHKLKKTFRQFKTFIIHHTTQNRPAFAITTHLTTRNNTRISRTRTKHINNSPRATTTFNHFIDTQIKIPFRRHSNTTNQFSAGTRDTNLPKILTRRRQLINHLTTRRFRLDQNITISRIHSNTIANTTKTPKRFKRFTSLRKRPHKTTSRRKLTNHIVAVIFWQVENIEIATSFFTATRIHRKRLDWSLKETFPTHARHPDQITLFIDIFRPPTTFQTSKRSRPTTRIDPAHNPDFGC